MFGKADELYQPPTRHGRFEIRGPSNGGKTSVREGPGFVHRVKETTNVIVDATIMLVVQETAEALDVCVPISICIQATKLVGICVIRSIMRAHEIVEG